MDFLGACVRGFLYGMVEGSDIMVKGGSCHELPDIGRLHEASVWDPGQCLLRGLWWKLPGHARPRR